MLIFIRNIPESTLTRELVEFVAPALRSVVPLKSGKVLSAEILVLFDKRTRITEYHGLVDVDSEKAGRRAVRKLNGTRFHGRMVMVREYVTRSWHNDRRHDHAEAVDAFGKGMRKGDRRRGKALETIDDVSNLFSSDKNFTRKAF
ncbi:MAG: hypothetical protein RL563_926 [Pseudomonadota bacterium]